MESSALLLFYAEIIIGYKMSLFFCLYCRLSVLLPLAFHMYPRTPQHIVKIFRTNFGYYTSCQSDRTVVYKNEKTNKNDIEEHILGYQSVDDTTGHDLFEFITEHLKSLELRGQSYDNDANMRGKHK
ncbi:hypothetical protein TNCV_1785701 [Trichonephila clavipes]|nr:hypothetical protein TNCV_1785701 [Trichonephila clavipes]